MKITRIETTRVKSLPHLLWVEIHTDEGQVGLGETFLAAEAVETYIHTVCAPLLLGKDPLQIERHSKILLRGYLGFNGSGVETRAASALDIALWDVFGQAVNQPIYQLLGGLSHDRMRAYNTCASVDADFSPHAERRGASSGFTGRYDDQTAFMTAPGELARSLIEQGFTAMKIWPFDELAGTSPLITSRQIARALEPFAEIRRTVGNDIEIMCDFMSQWDTTAALAIARALKDYNIFWMEDPIKMDSVRALADYRRQSGMPVCGSETLATRGAFRDLLAADALDYVMIDLSWCGGISEAKKIATMAEAYQKPVAPHDCTGPVVLMASLHVALSAPNAIFQEVVRAYLADFYGDLVTQLPVLEHGWLSPPMGPGLGTALSPALRAREDSVLRVSTLT